MTLIKEKFGRPTEHASQVYIHPLLAYRATLDPGFGAGAFRRPLPHPLLDTRLAFKLPENSLPVGMGTQEQLAIAEAEKTTFYYCSPLLPIQGEKGAYAFQYYTYSYLYVVDEYHELRERTMEKYLLVSDTLIFQGLLVPEDGLYTRPLDE